ncbi:hypothetical protein [Actinoplanes sp. DH11]|nr:hypothetical protein [Actinoplanes sp. DH11]
MKPGVPLDADSTPTGTTLIRTALIRTALIGTARTHVVPAEIH